MSSVTWLQEQIILGSKELTGSDKLIWLVMRQLDRGPKGAFISERALAERVGLGMDNVKRRRAGLVAAGLLTADKQPGRRSALWRVQWPATVPVPAQFTFSLDFFTALRDDFDGAVRIAREDAAERERARLPQKEHAEREHSDAPMVHLKQGGKGALESMATGALRSTLSGEAVHSSPPDGCTPVPESGALQCPESSEEHQTPDMQGEIGMSSEDLNTLNLRGAHARREPDRSHERTTPAPKMPDTWRQLMHRLRPSTSEA